MGGFVGGQDVGYYAIYSDLAGYGSGCAAVVAGEHYDVYARLLDLGDGGLRLRAGGVGYGYDAYGLAV